MTLHATHYTIPYSERAFFGLSESMVLVNGTQIMNYLDLREVCVLLGTYLKSNRKTHFRPDFEHCATDLRERSEEPRYESSFMLKITIEME